MLLRRATVSQVGAGPSAWIAVSPQNPCQIGFAITIEAGTIDAFPQITFDDLAGFPEEIDLPMYDSTGAIVSSVTVKTAGNVDKPITGIRLFNNDAGGTAKLTINQYIGS